MLWPCFHLFVLNYKCFNACKDVLCLHVDLRVSCALHWLIVNIEQPHFIRLFPGDHLPSNNTEYSTFSPKFRKIRSQRYCLVSLLFTTAKYLFQEVNFISWRNIKLQVLETEGSYMYLYKNRKSQFHAKKKYIIKTHITTFFFTFQISFIGLYWSHNG